MLRSGEADVALSIETPGSCSTPPEGIVLEPLLDDHMYAVLPAGHRLAGRRRVKLEDLATDAWIVGSSSGECPDARIVLQACAAAGFEPDIAFQNDDYQAIQGFIAAGVGVSLIPELALAMVRDDVVVLPLTRSCALPPDRRGDARRRLGVAGQAADARGPARGRRGLRRAPRGPAARELRERQRPRRGGAFCSAPKRTRTSTRLSRTRPST